jgi:tRNA threonylcarbamoyl adenosine modification protein YeaZ
MIILGIDTSGRDGSVALARGSGERFEVLGLMPIAGGTYSAQLIPAIAALLAGAFLAKGAIDLLAVASGPGSFTGLRVGLSTVKGLAEALTKPIVAVSLLAASAAAARQTASVVAALDAQRGEVYVGEYQVGYSEVPSELSLHRIGELLLSLSPTRRTKPSSGLCASPVFPWKEFRVRGRTSSPAWEWLNTSRG